jgi:3-(3-hydroxy-phenyl)propionate hydroxylase
MIARVGLIEQFIQEGLVARYFQFWDKPAWTKIVEFDHARLRDETPYPFVVQTEQHKLARMGIERLKTFPDAEVRFATRATAVTQDADSATVTAEGPDGNETFSGDYVIGADGGRSTIRKALDIEFEGFTWPEHFLVLTTLDDFQELLPGSAIETIWPIRMNGPIFSKSRAMTAKGAGARCSRPGLKRATKRRWAMNQPILAYNGYSP